MGNRRPVSGRAQPHDPALAATLPDSRPASRLLISILLASIAVCPLFRALAEEDRPMEYQVKLAFLYNFAQFTQWPADAFSSQAAPMRICVVGSDPFQGDAERGLRGRTAAGHQIEIRTVKPDDDLKPCHIVFVRSSERKGLPKILAGLQGASALTVGESAGFAVEGGIVNLTLEDSKLRFEINLDAAVQTKLKISSKVLALAKIVKGSHNP
jgi:hypothetical protein